MDSLLGKLPELFKNEKQLRDIWSNPLTRKELLEYTRTEKLDKLFILASQMDTLAFKSVQQLESLIAQKAELERDLGLLNERLSRLNEEK